MDSIAPYFKLTFGAQAAHEAIILAGQARFTVLSDRMIRMEFSADERFEDRASQAIWFRAQDVPPFTSGVSEGVLSIDTGALLLRYQVGKPFAADTLQIEIRATQTTWHFGDPDPGNLGGTARTLDAVNGATPLETGLVSRSGWSVIDDSRSLIFDENSWLKPRGACAGQLDLYFMGFGHDYLAALAGFNRISGSVPMIPRWVLGNWWSRYWAYTQQELSGLMDEFERREIPLSVCIIDMDWHVTETGNQSSGWTGYTWNRKLFPDPAGFLAYLHAKGLKMALNLHPADGIHPHEEAYEAMARAIGQDPAEQQPVAFDIAEPSFADAYFRILHHPQEEKGMDFWWMDWQQGLKSKVEGLDPLWWLNHLHFYDLGRSGERRSFIFSRWGGLGNHRYPIGFSGDSVVSWQSLAFQPYFTATASNVNYGWWSHDIGGHMGGIENGELNTRWMQMGVFFPVLRIHCTKSEFQDRRPWAYDAESYEVTRDAMRLRHTLIPYLYSMAWRYHHENIPPLLPMYYTHPETEAAYAAPNQFWFGNQLVIAPFITPRDSETGLSRAVVWLPQGDWYDFFKGEHYSGDGFHAVYGTLHDIPAFAKAGAIVPLAPPTGEFGTPTPQSLVIRVFAGADGAFDLYEDEGNSNTYLQGEYAITPLRLAWSGTRATFTIEAAQGATQYVPAARNLTLDFRGFVEPGEVSVLRNGAPVAAKLAYDAVTRTFTLSGFTLDPSDRLEVTLSGAGDLADHSDSRLAHCQTLLKGFQIDTWAKEAILPHLDAILEDPRQIGRLMTGLSDKQMQALLEVITGAGMEYSDFSGKPLLITWNNQANENVSLHVALARTHHFWLYKERFPWASGTAPRFESFRPEDGYDNRNLWVVQMNYYGFFTVKHEHKTLELGE